MTIAVESDDTKHAVIKLAQWLIAENTHYIHAAMIKNRWR
ncbi:hypothetical protein I553_7878 [Mycobacterium xenopi 4042]|uniref:Uncharacterized protein n=2 Tax=Mycobacterium xenopi TaxID=1789 RepID=A0AAD1M1A1_MYCXE|nr:hypothetical protein I552_9845 [Mycobacterium xenopi 3993]EUA33467.1 hypothetical protein I553_7878 [Mycobacterium xenopi 4042]BBU22221.1 hypothetical protein MYXE_20110 [Mycobacterium xenopi]SPX78113.1 Uncharacterised protein [Mycobacterium xenopi]